MPFHFIEKLNALYERRRQNSRRKKYDGMAALYTTNPKAFRNTLRFETAKLAEQGRLSEGTFHRIIGAFEPQNNRSLMVQVIGREEARLKGELNAAKDEQDHGKIDELEKQVAGIDYLLSYLRPPKAEKPAE